MISLFGTVCLDRIRRVARLPEKGGYIEIDDQIELLGGEAANTAAALRLWGASPFLAGNPIGTGAYGDALVGLLNRAGLADAVIPRQNVGTPFCDIYVTPDGERTMFGRGFKSMEEFADPKLARYQLGGWFSADPNCGQAARDAVCIAREAGMRLYLLDFFRPADPVDGAEHFWQSSTDWVGIRGNLQRNQEYVEAFVARHGCFTILSDGPNGCVAGGNDIPVRPYPPFPCKVMVDSTGAGDIFRAGMLFGLDQGWTVSACLKFASAAGSLSCRGLGATSLLPTKDEIEALIFSNPAVARQYD